MMDIFEQLFQAQRAHLLSVATHDLLEHLEAATQRWHEGEGDTLTLRMFLGLTEEEYQVFALTPAQLPELFAQAEDKAP